MAEKVLKEGPWPKFYFTKNGKGGIRRKTYLSDVGGVPPTNLWEYKDVGHTDEAKKELMAIFGGKSPFDTPKPVRLIERILKIATDKDSIVLDSFAGSGTTAHAVLKMNKEDGGNRRFILVEMMDYAETVTAERVKRVISGYGQGDKAVAGTGGGFGYYELGEPLMNGEVLNENLPVEKIREYVWFMETRETGGSRLSRPNGTDATSASLPREMRADVTSAALPCMADAQERVPPVNDPYLLGAVDETAYYFCYEKAKKVTLNRALLRRLKTKAERYVIYADICLIEAAELKKMNIVFKKIPRDITRL
jgi:adenine-specific DNA-methyltransferase